MANRTVKDAHTVHGTNPQYLIEKIIRSRIYECKYWKEECFGLSAEDVVDRAVNIKYIGGVYGGNIKPTPFLCLLLKLLQIQPDKDIIIEFIKQDTYKYVRALGATYLRLVGETAECYRYLETLYNDYRKLKRQDRQGNFSLLHMDEFVDELLHEERCFDVILPRIPKRHVLEDTGLLEQRQSLLDEDLEDVRLSGAEDEEDENPTDDTAALVADNAPSATRRNDPREHEDSHRDRRRGGSRDRDRRHRSRSRSRDRNRDRDRVRERERDRDRRSGGDRSRRENKERGTREKDRTREKERTNGSNEDREIREANELRAKLGLAPLKP